MDTRSSLYIDNLMKRVDEIEMITPQSLARTLALYIKVLNNNSVVNNVSCAYIDSYDGKKLYARFKLYFDNMYEMFLKNALDSSDRRLVFKNVAKRLSKLPTSIKGMKYVSQLVIEESHSLMKMKKTLNSKREIVEKFKNAIKKYLNLTFSLGFNEPSECVKTLIDHHKIDKYIMSGDFPVILLPFLPDIESRLKSCYENYEMKDAWEMLKGRYFNHKADYANIALEIKANFIKNIKNFSDYFDGIYTDTYYKMRLIKK